LYSHQHKLEHEPGRLEAKIGSKGWTQRVEAKVEAKGGSKGCKQRVEAKMEGGQHNRTAHAQPHSTCTKAQHMHNRTAHAQPHSTCTTAQHMHNRTAHAQPHSTCTHHKQHSSTAAQQHSSTADSRIRSLVGNQDVWSIGRTQGRIRPPPPASSGGGRNPALIGRGAGRCTLYASRCAECPCARRWSR
jgi:hypothetical protein